MGSVCLTCGRGTMEPKRGTFRFDPPPNIPGGTIEIENAEWRECTECGEQILGRELDRRLDDAARHRLGLLSPAEIKEIRERIGLSQEAMAQWLGVGDKTYTRWETGKSIQNKSNDTLIRLVARNAGIFSELDAEREPDRSKRIAEYVHSLHDLKGESPLAMAAHGGELPERVVEELRQRLRAILQFQRNRKG
ncbi:MAG: type II toxin-antitoxin system MqsA family antitoxin [Phycisphaerae bacterium]|nr:type II toxin-antitoxin system MqsA family antitoxin [Phycisphaerae bacterium]